MPKIFEVVIRATSFNHRTILSDFKEHYERSYSLPPLWTPFLEVDTTLEDPLSSFFAPPKAGSDESFANQREVIHVKKLFSARTYPYPM